MPTYDFAYFMNASTPELVTLEENANENIAENATNHRVWREAVIEWRAIGSNPPTPPPPPPGHITV